MWMECFDIYARTFIHIVAIEYIKQHWYSVTKHTNRDRDRDTNKCHHQRQSHRKHTNTTLFHFAHLIPFETYIHSNSVFQLISKCFTISIKWNKSHLLWLRKNRSMNSKLSKNSRFSMYRNVWPCIRWNHSVARICIKLSMAQNLFCVYIPTTKWNQMSKKKKRWPKIRESVGISDGHIQTLRPFGIKLGENIDWMIQQVAMKNAKDHTNQPINHWHGHGNVSIWMCSHSSHQIILVKYISYFCTDDDFQRVRFASIATSYEKKRTDLRISSSKKNKTIKSI